MLCLKQATESTFKLAVLVDQGTLFQSFEADSGLQMCVHLRFLLYI